MEGLLLTLEQDCERPRRMDEAAPPISPLRMMERRDFGEVFCVAQLIVLKKERLKAEG